MKLPLYVFMIFWFAVFSVICFLYTRAIHNTLPPLYSVIRTVNIREGVNKSTTDIFSRSRKMVKRYPMFEMCGNVLYLSFV